MYFPLVDGTGFPRFLSNGYSLSWSIWFIQDQYADMYAQMVTDLIMTALGSSNSSAETGHNGAVRRRILNKIDWT
jgi:hypothetical protein